jgi:coenzyme Q-binding protein COQ10
MDEWRVEREWRREFPDIAPARLFAMVSDIESYPSFVPGFISARIRERREDCWLVENVVGFGPVSRRFMTKATFDMPHRLDIRAEDGPSGTFEMGWRFEPSGAGCRLGCRTVIGFPSRLAAAVAQAGMGNFERLTIAAFERRAASLPR